MHHYMPTFLNEGRNTDDSQSILENLKDIPKPQNLVHTIHYSND